MKAFLSHSSLDKDFVEQVFERLGASQAHIDSHTFEKAVLNVEAIERALGESDLFVLFVSERSLDSHFVNFESRKAFERLASGVIRRVLILCIDDTSIESIPTFIRDLNIVTTLSSPGAAYRRIQALLIELETEAEASTEFWVGRETELTELKRAITLPTDTAPVAITIAGQPGSGRRSLVRKAFSEVLPSYQHYVPLPVAKDASIDDFHLGLVRLRGRRSARDLMHDIRTFQGLEETKKIDAIVAELDQLLAEGETLLLIDLGGLTTLTGDYHPYLEGVIEAFENSLRPALVIIQQYMPPSRVRRKYGRVHFQSIGPLSRNDVASLLGSRLKDVGAYYSQRHIDALVKLVGGHPLNVEFAMAEIEGSGNNVALFLADPSNLVIWRDRRAESYINNIKFSPTAKQIIGLLLVYRYLPLELMLELVSGSAEAIAEAVNYLRGWHCIVFDGAVYSINQLLFEAFERTEKFRLSRKSETASATRIVEIVAEYKDNDDVGVALIEPGIIASIRAGHSGATTQLRQLLLPSHLLKVARDAYNRRRYAECVNFAKEALEKSYRMTPDARIEAHRLIASSAARMGDSDDFESSVQAINKTGGAFARRTALFLQGLNHRIRGNHDSAETAYLKCWELDPKNVSVARELAQIYLWQDRFEEAESFARDALRVAPTNPFILDIMVGVITGRSTTAELGNDAEFRELLEELERSGKGDLSFYPRRMAEIAFKKGDMAAARQWADEAVKGTPHLVVPYFIRAKISLSEGKWPQANKDIQQVEDLISSGSNDEGRFHLVPLYRLQFEAFLNRREYKRALELLDGRGAMLPTRLIAKLRSELSQSILYDERVNDPHLLEWARSFVKGRA